VGAKDEAVCFSADKIDRDRGTNPHFWFGSGSAALMESRAADGCDRLERRTCPSSISSRR